MGGKGSVSYPPSSDYTSLATAQMEQQLASMTSQSQTTMLLMQQQFEQQLATLQAAQAESTSEAPTITEYDVDWESTIDELEAQAYADIAEITSWGEASGTNITSPLLWEDEPDVIYKSLLAS